MVLASLLLIVNMMLWSLAAYSTNTVKSDGYQTALHFGIINFFVSALIYPSLSQKVPISILYQGVLWIGLLLGIAETLFTFSLAIT